ncbi:MAG: hypothetical protein JW741_26610 [Sedimentisphaerales bacterium]|nr:hypothetical protein [Sedimentisphaerales bacterium]
MGAGMLIVVVVVAAVLVIASGVWVAVALLRAMADLNRKAPTVRESAEFSSAR